MTTLAIKIKGMSCGHCSSAVEQSLSQIPGIRSVAANYNTNEVTVEHDGTVALKDIEAGIEDIGFELESYETV